MSLAEVTVEGARRGHGHGHGHSAAVTCKMPLANGKCIMSAADLHKIADEARSEFAKTSTVVFIFLIHFSDARFQNMISGRVAAMIPWLAKIAETFPQRPLSFVAPVYSLDLHPSALLPSLSCPRRATTAPS